MQYTLLGHSGIRVSRIVLGTAAFGVVPEERDAQAVVDAALDQGINFFDTATAYGNRASQDRPGVPPAAERAAAEAILGNCLKGQRSRVIIATKVQNRVGPGVNDAGLSRLHIMERLEISLKRLHTDYVDIYYAHHPDPDTPIEETMRAFDDLIRQGKVRYFAISNFPGWGIADVVLKAEKWNLNAPIVNQVPYSLTDRRCEAEIVPAARYYGLGLTCYAPLAGGLLTGMETIRSRPISLLGGQRWRQGRGSGFTPAELKAADDLDALAHEWELPASQVALAWLLSRPAVNCAIIGPETPGELLQNAPAADLSLSQDQLTRVDAVGT